VEELDASAGPVWLKLEDVTAFRLGVLRIQPSDSVIPFVLALTLGFELEDLAGVEGATTLS
jgi:hypothetical protein